jgi:uncharacterized phage protein (TIGR01671 family)
MNREIKFRAWDKEGQEMYDVAMINWEAEEIAYTDHPTGYEADALLEQVELMQYTGLKDKNGKEIYEGDILKSLSQVFSEENQDALISEVYYHDSYAAFYLLASNRDFEINEPLAQSIHNYEILEVIGNIYENPELLEVYQ